MRYKLCYNREWGVKFTVGDLREVVWCVAGTEVSCAKTDVCECSKNKFISINQLKLQGAWEISCNRWVSHAWDVGLDIEESLLRSPRCQTRRKHYCELRNSTYTPRPAITGDFLLTTLFSQPAATLPKPWEQTPAAELEQGSTFLSTRSTACSLMPI